ncbi:hypothetical protein R1flu_009232 [Riccia fluitans]|uniref:Uncharacterized protein n=1 Tax=Riccia fluitans TaxID=41844 RepID=A0ABD1Z2C1_9MARC
MRAKSEGLPGKIINTRGERTRVGCSQNVDGKWQVAEAGWTLESVTDHEQHTMTKSWRGRGRIDEKDRNRSRAEGRACELGRTIVQTGGRSEKANQVCKAPKTSGVATWWNKT